MPPREIPFMIAVGAELVQEDTDLPNFGAAGVATSLRGTNGGLDVSFADIEIDHVLPPIKHGELRQ